MRFFFALLAALALIVGAFAQAAPSDVPKGHWGYKAVDDLYKAGILQGYPDAKFNGSRTVSHYELAAAVGKTQDDLTGIKQAMAELQAQLKSLKQQIADLKKQISEFRGN